ncbi:MAG: hypothetical protein HRU20_20005 [Pseudomonadales bacterium]|nr:hypothetical protein [Pseudomonadales bacterium]
MLGLFNTQAPIDEESINWIFSCFSWALENFDARFFEKNTQLILLDENFFPGSFDSVHAMASGIFARVQDYSGLQHWPFELVEPEAFQATPIMLQAALSHSPRGQKKEISAYSADYHPLPISYQPQQINKPDALAASFAHLLAQHQLFQAQIDPPGGKETLPQATEIIAVMMGFGLLMANTAYTFRGGCGSCYNPAENRQAALSENHTLYALALFCHLKGIDNKVPLKQLKKHLRGIYKRAYKDITNRQEQLQQLKIML